MKNQGTSQPEVKTIDNFKTIKSFKVQLGDFNEIISCAMEVLNHWTPEDDLLSSQSTPFSPFRAETTQWLLPPKRRIISSRDPYPYSSKQAPMKSQLRPIEGSSQNFQNVYSKILSKDLRLAKLAEIKQAEVHFSLQRLAILVKMYLEEHGAANLENIYLQILGKCRRSMGLTENEAEELLTNMRRRICQVLRVFDGIGAVRIEKKLIVMTDLGRLKGRGLLKHAGNRKSLLEQKEAQLQKLYQKQKELEQKLLIFRKFQERNKRLIYQEESPRQQKGQLNEVTFSLPLTFIGGQPRPISGLFRTLHDDDFHSVEVNRQEGTIMIKGDNLRVVQFDEVVQFLGVTLAK